MNEATNAARLHAKLAKLRAKLARTEAAIAEADALAERGSVALARLGATRAEVAAARAAGVGLAEALDAEADARAAFEAWQGAVVVAVREAGGLPLH